LLVRIIYIATDYLGLVTFWKAS